MHVHVHAFRACTGRLKAFLLCAAVQHVADMSVLCVFFCACVQHKRLILLFSTLCMLPTMESDVRVE